MSAVRSSSSCLVSEEGARVSEKSGWTPAPAPSHSAAALTLIRVGGGQDGAVLFFHLLHILRQLLNATPDLFHLGRQIGDASQVFRPDRASTGLMWGSGKWADPEGLVKGQRTKSGEAGVVGWGPGSGFEVLETQLPVQRTHP